MMPGSGQLARNSRESAVLRGEGDARAPQFVAWYWRCVLGMVSILSRRFHDAKGASTLHMTMTYVYAVVFNNPHLMIASIGSEPCKGPREQGAAGSDDQGYVQPCSDVASQQTRMSRLRVHVSHRKAQHCLWDHPNGPNSATVGNKTSTKS